MKKLLIGAGIALLLVAAGIAFITYVCEDDWCFLFPWQKVNAVNSFERCASLGFPVMNSYPRQCSAGDKTFSETVVNQPPPPDANASDVRVTSPQPNASVNSPLTITGEAKGNFYFEAVFPVKLLDADGNLVAQGQAHALGDWMTENFVPYKAVLIFAQPKTKTGTLVLQNDNPSGLPERAKEVRIAVQFSDNASPVSGAFGKPASVRLGEQVAYPDGLIVGLKEVNDSRCKEGVQCIWQGELSPVLVLLHADFDVLPVEVRLGTVTAKTASGGGYEFSLQSATENSVTFVVSKSVKEAP